MTQSYIYIPFLILSSIMVYSKRLDIVLCAAHRTSLLIHSKCNSLHELTPNSKSIPLSSPSPLANNKFVLYICESVSVLQLPSFVPYLESTYKLYHMVFVFLYLTSLSMSISSCYKSILLNVCGTFGEFLVFFVSLGPHILGMEVPRIGV